MKISKKYLFIILLFTLVAIPLFSFAAGGSTTVVPTIANPLKGNNNDLYSLINTILKNVVMPIAAVASVLYIIWAGFLYVRAQGNPGKITEANQNLLWALIGIGVLLGAAGISEVIQNTVKSLVNID